MIPCLLVVFTWKLEMLMTFLGLCKVMVSNSFFFFFFFFFLKFTVSVNCSCLWTLTCFLQSDFGRPTIDLGMHDIGNLGYEVSHTSDFQDSDSVSTQTWALGRRLSNHNYFWKQKILEFFGKWTNKIQVFNYAIVENLKTVWANLTSYKTVFKSMNVIGLFA